MDEKLISGKNYNYNFWNLGQVLKVISGNSLRLKFKNCGFMQPEDLSVESKIMTDVIFLFQEKIETIQRTMAKNPKTSQIWRIF